MSRVFKIGFLAATHGVPLLVIFVCQTIGLYEAIDNYIDFFFLWSFGHVLIGLRTEYKFFEKFDISQSEILFIVSLLVTIVLFIFLFFDRGIFFATCLASSVLFSYFAHVYSVWRLSCGDDKAFIYIHATRSCLIAFFQAVSFYIAPNEFLVLGHTCATIILGFYFGYKLLCASKPFGIAANSYKKKISVSDFNLGGVLFYGLISYTINIIPLHFFSNFDTEARSLYFLFYRIVIGGGLVISAIFANEILSKYKSSLKDNKGKLFIDRQKIFRYVFVIASYLIIFELACLVALIAVPWTSISIDKMMIWIIIGFFPRLLFSPITGLFDATGVYRNINILLLNAIFWYHIGLFFSLEPVFLTFSVTWLIYCGAMILISISLARVEASQTKV